MGDCAGERSMNFGTWIFQNHRYLTRKANAGQGVELREFISSTSWGKLRWIGRIWRAP